MTAFNKVIPRVEVAVVTGAAGGLGAAFPLQLSKKDCHLALTLLHPGGGSTCIATSVRLTGRVSAQDTRGHQKNWHRTFRLSPDTAAQWIFLGIEQRLPRVLAGKDTMVAACWVQPWFPSTYERWVAQGVSRSFRHAV